MNFSIPASKITQCVKANEEILQNGNNIQQNNQRKNEKCKCKNITAKLPKTQSKISI